LRAPPLPNSELLPKSQIFQEQIAAEAERSDNQNEKKHRSVLNIPADRCAKGGLQLSLFIALMPDTIRIKAGTNMVFLGFQQGIFFAFRSDSNKAQRTDRIKRAIRIAPVSKRGTRSGSHWP
jgi:hypothetical protein